MGYLLIGHVVRDEAPFQELDQLPESLSWRVFRQPDLDAHLVEVFTASRVPEWPFTFMPSVRDIPLGLPDDLAVLSRIYGVLEQIRLANPFKRGLLNLNLQISSLLGAEVLTFCTDDDELDFVCVSRAGALSKLHCQCGDLEITHFGDKTVIQPLRPEMEEEEEFLTDLDVVRSQLDGIQLQERNKDWPTELHRIAMQEVSQFLATDSAPLGLGQFDPPELGLNLTASSSRASSVPEKKAHPANPEQQEEAKRKWWEFWK